MRSFFATCLAAVVIAAPTAEKVTSLPDTTPFDSDTYSGYLKVSDTKELHYVFTESLDAPTTDPVLIWFNGGPGCSSMLGFMQENGPRIIDDGETVVKTNPYPWNTRANVMWLESPAGVGFSTAGTAQDLKTNDTVQSQDALAALKAWYVKFPEFKTNELFVSGESYAGIYVPYLAYQIYQNNLQAAFDSSLENINIKGTMVGNGATDWDFDSNPSFPDTVRNFNMIPKDLWQTYQDNDCHQFFRNIYPMSKSPICLVTIEKINNATGTLNWYDLYRQDVSTDTLEGESRYGTTMINGEKKTYRRGYTRSEYTPWLPATQGNEPILGDYVSDYMNQNSTRTALHIPESVPAWEMCSQDLEYHLQNEASLWIYNVLQNSGIAMMFYSGDTDGAIPTYGSKQWLAKLNRKVTEAWRPWYTDGQVSGFVEKYDGVQFVTVKGVGHMAPQWARQPVTDMITHWIHGEPF